MLTPISTAALEWRLLVPDEAHLAYALYQQASAALLVGLVRVDTLETFRRHLNGDGLILGGFHGQKLVAYGVLTFQSELAQLLAHKLGVNSTKGLALLDGAACLPEWQGQHLHQELIQLRLQQALQRRSNGCIMATVSPHNLPSLRNLLRAGFCVQKAVHLYQGLERLLLLYRAEQHWQEMYRASLYNFAEHGRATAAGWQGFACVFGQQKQEWQLCYGQPVIESIIQ